KNDVKINGIKNYHASLLLTHDCEVTFEDKGSSYLIPPKSIAFLEKGLTFSVRLTEDKEGKCYHLFTISEEIMSKILIIFENMNIRKKLTNPSSIRTLEDKVYIIESNDYDYTHINEKSLLKEDEMSLICKLAYLLSKIKKRDELYYSMCVSVSKSFSDSVRELVEKNINKKWRVLELAEYFHCSEVTIRKKLEREMLSFNKIILDVRMSVASKLILNTNYNIDTISEAVGISSTSYFIRLFHQYFGVTPKKYHLALRRKEK
ncbi:TPA: helix-turn-helix transcriptional regulator, partial [Escherichia coli]|nr:helix-turn-helix transcriptional regulator [Escherichia coli]